MKYMIAVLMMFAPLAFAGGPLVDNSTNQNQGQAQGQLQGQAQGQGQSQSLHNSNKNTAVAGAISGSKSGSESSSNSQSGSSNSLSINEEATHRTAASAPTIYSAGCQAGASGQTYQGGVSMIVDDPVCQNLKLADAYSKAFQMCDNSACQDEMSAEIKNHLTAASDHAKRVSDAAHFAVEGSATGVGTLGYSVPPAVGFIAGGPVGVVIGSAVSLGMILTD